jgi:enolase
MKIVRIIGREVYDSRGWPTIQCELFLENGQSVLSFVPSGLSTGMYEAIELRDGGKRLCGKGVLKAIENIEQVIAPQLVGKEPQAVEMDLKMIEIDGTQNKSRLGANAMLAVSMALYRAEALIEDVKLYELIAYVMEADSVSLPFPLLNIINGGAHASNNLQIQEFMVVPVGAPNFRSAFEVGVLVFHELGSLLKARNKSLAVGDEGGFACNFSSDTEAFDILLEAIEKVNNTHTLSCVIAIDVAASQFYNTVTKRYRWHDKQLTSDEMIDFYQDLTKKYPIYSIEDGLSEDDWASWVKMTKVLENKTQVVADDLFVTNIYRIMEGSDEHAANSVIIKPNQVGTITESLQAIKLCKSQRLNTIVSHRSGETEDTFIADLAVGSSAGQIKAGGCCRSERIAKYNRLLTIEDELALMILDA